MAARLTAKLLSTPSNNTTANLQYTMKRILTLLLLTVVSAAAVTAGILKFNSTTSYRIESVYFSGSAIAIGANHNVNSPLCVERNTGTANESDCFWFFEYKGDGKYAICNASTKQYVTLDDSYEDSPQVLRYIHLSSSVEGDASLWYIKASKYNDTDVYYIQNANKPAFFFNMRTRSFVLGAYELGENQIPSNMNEIFKLYDSNGNEYVQEEIDENPNPGPGPEPEPGPEPTDSTSLLPIDCPVVHVYRADGKLDAFPQDYIIDQSTTADSTKITVVNGQTFAYAAYEIDSVSMTAPEMPHFLSFKFNNKYNHNIIGDSPGTFYGDSLITAYVIGIGKNLRPSFNLDDNTQAWIADKPQISKKSSARFDRDIRYTIAHRGYSIMRQRLDSTFVMCPYGSETTVRVDFATDHATAEYKVPTIRIYTSTGGMISSKKQYVQATISIDGGGVFPDMPETEMLIKGRGNSSWAGAWGKSPYHMKFATGVKPLGLTKGKHWNLIANAQKYSMTTNAIAMKMAQLVETAGFNHEIPVELYINGDYRGSYNLTEKIGFANNSIDLPSETYATMLELDSYYDDEQKFRTDYYDLPVNIKEPDFSKGLTELTKEQIEASFNRVVTSLYNEEDISYMIDLDYLARFLFVDEFTANFELMHPKSTFCYNPNVMNADSKYIFGPVWDFDWGYGYVSNKNYFTAYSNVDFWNRVQGNGYPWAYRQRYCGEKFDKKYYNLWHEFVTGGKLDELIDFCDDYYEFAALSFTHDDTKWKHGDAAAYATVTENAKTWLRRRANYVLDYMTNTLGYGDKGYLTSHLDPIPGDVNGDGRVTTADVVCVFNHILGLPNEEFNFPQADIDGNDIITIADLMGVRGLIGTYKSKGFYGLPVAEATLNTSPLTVDRQGVEIPLTVNVDEGSYCAMQFDLNIPSGMLITDLDISQSIPDFDINIVPIAASEGQTSSIDRYRVSIYSSAKNLIPKGTSVITLRLDWGSHQETTDMLCATMSDIMFVNSMGEDERTDSRSATFVHNELTGINDVTVSVTQNGSTVTVSTGQKTAIPVYGTDGRIFRVMELNAGTSQINLPAGIYIINNKKVLIP